MATTPLRSTPPVTTHPANPREAKAASVLRSLQDEGYTVRHILTEALLRLGDAEQGEARALDGMRDQLEAVLRAVHTLQASGGGVVAPPQPPEEEKPALSPDLLEAMRANAPAGKSL